MKYVPLRDFVAINDALNFTTPDLHVIGGCDIYTTKATGGHKKLYRDIEENMALQVDGLVRQRASMSPPRCSQRCSKKKSNKKRGLSAPVPEKQPTNPTTYGAHGQIPPWSKFVYMVATLNISHPDYDFSNILRPRDFRKERSIRRIMQNVDDTLMNVTAASSFIAHPSRATSVASSAEIWSPAMWEVIDKEMSLTHCEKFSCEPKFDDDDGGIWSMHYLFYNKQKRRVCYLYLRGLSVISHSPVQGPAFQTMKRHLRKASGSATVGDGAGKRASYWLGSLGMHAGLDTSEYEEDDDDEMVEEEGLGMDMDIGDIRGDLERGFEAGGGWGEAEQWEGAWELVEEGRGMEGVADMMEL